jgi:hypothetical protein
MKNARLKIDLKLWSKFRRVKEASGIWLLAAKN